MQLTHATRIAGRWHTEQGVTTRGEPLIEHRSEFRERPNIHYWRYPTPARQNTNDFNPTKVTLGPTTIWRACVHLLGHLFSGVRRCAFEDFGIVVVKPLNSMIPIERLDVLTHPATEIAMAVGVDLDLFRRFIHGLGDIIRQFAFVIAAQINYIAIRYRIRLFVR